MPSTQKKSFGCPEVSIALNRLSVNSWERFLAKLSIRFLLGVSGCYGGSSLLVASPQRILS
jgi:hypothetical protein